MSETTPTSKHKSREYINEPEIDIFRTLTAKLLERPLNILGNSFTASVAIISNLITFSLCLGISRISGPRRFIFRQICRNFSIIKRIGRKGSRYNGSKFSNFKTIFGHVINKWLYFETPTHFLQYVGGGIDESFCHCPCNV